MIVWLTQPHIAILSLSIKPISMNFLQHRDHLSENNVITTFLFIMKYLWISCQNIKQQMRSLHSACHITEVTECWLFRHTLPHSCYLILHFERPKALVDSVHYFITSVAGSPSIKAGDNDPVWTGEVSAPVQLETIVHLSTTGAGIPAQVSSRWYVCH